MEQLVDAQHGPIAGILIVLCIHAVIKLFNFSITLIKSLREVDNKKIDHLAKSMEENTKAILELTVDLKNLGNRIIEADISAVKQEYTQKRIIATVKELAGDRWASIQEKIRKEEFMEGE